MKKQDIENHLRQAGIVVGELQAEIAKLKQANQQQKVWLEKLATVHGLEWSQDVNDWVDKTKLEALKKTPRD